MQGKYIGKKALRSEQSLKYHQGSFKKVGKSELKKNKQSSSTLSNSDIDNHM